MILLIFSALQEHSLGTLQRPCHAHLPTIGAVDRYIDQFTTWFVFFRYSSLFGLTLLSPDLRVCEGMSWFLAKDWKGWLLDASFRVAVMYVRYSRRSSNKSRQTLRYFRTSRACFVFPLSSSEFSCVVCWNNLQIFGCYWSGALSLSKSKDELLKSFLFAHTISLYFV